MSDDDLLDTISGYCTNYTTNYAKTSEKMSMCASYMSLYYLGESMITEAIDYLIDAIEAAELMVPTDTGFINVNVAIAKVYRQIITAVDGSTDPTTYATEVADLDAAYNDLLEGAIADENAFAIALSEANELSITIEADSSSSSYEKKAISYFVSALEEFEDDEFTKLLKKFQYGLANLARKGTSGTYFTDLKNISYSIFQVFYGSIMLQGYSSAITYLCGTTYMYSVILDLYSDSTKPAVNWDCGTTTAGADVCEGYENCTRVTQSLPSLDNLTCIGTRYNHAAPDLTTDQVSTILGSMSVACQSLANQYVQSEADDFITALGKNISSSSYIMESKLYMTYAYIYFITKNTDQVSTIITDYNTLINEYITEGILDVTESIATPLQYAAMTLSSLSTADYTDAITYLTSAFTADFSDVTALVEYETIIEVLTSTYNELVTVVDASGAKKSYTTSLSDLSDSFATFSSKYALITYTGEDGIDILPYLDREIEQLYADLLAAGSSTDYDVMAMYYLDKVVSKLALGNYTGAMESFQFVIAFGIQMSIDDTGFDDVNSMAYIVYLVLYDVLIDFDSISDYQTDFSSLLYTYAYYLDIYSDTVSTGSSVFPALSTLQTNLTASVGKLTSGTDEYTMITDLSTALSDISAAASGLSILTDLQDAIEAVSDVSTLSTEGYGYLMQGYFTVIGTALLGITSESDATYLAAASLMETYFNPLLSPVASTTDTTDALTNLSTITATVTTNLTGVDINSRALSSFSSGGLQASIANQVVATPSKGSIGVVLTALTGALNALGVEDTSTAVKMVEVAADVFEGVSAEVAATTVAASATVVAVMGMVAATYLLVSSGVVSLADSGLAEQAYGIGVNISTMQTTLAGSTTTDKTGTVETKGSGTPTESDDTSGDDDGSSSDSGSSSSSSSSSDDDDDDNDDYNLDGVDDTTNAVTDPDSFEESLRRAVEGILTISGISDNLTTATMIARAAGINLGGLYRTAYQYGTASASTDIVSSGPIMVSRLQGAVNLMSGEMDDTTGAMPLLRNLVNSLSDLLSQAISTYDTGGVVDITPLTDAITTMENLESSVAAGTAVATTVDYTDITTYADDLDGDVSDLGTYFSGVNVSSATTTLDTIDTDMSTSADALAAAMLDAIQTGSLDQITTARGWMDTYQEYVDELLQLTTTWTDTFGADIPSGPATSIETSIGSMASSASMIRNAENSYEAGSAATTAMAATTTDLSSAGDISATYTPADGLNVAVQIDVASVTAGARRVNDYMEAEMYAEASQEVVRTAQTISNAVTEAYIAQGTAIGAGDTDAMVITYNLVGQLQAHMSTVNQYVEILSIESGLEEAAEVPQETVSSLILSMTRLAPTAAALYDELTVLEPTVVADATASNPFDSGATVDTATDDDFTALEEEAETANEAITDTTVEVEGTAADATTFVTTQPVTTWEQLAEGEPLDPLGEPTTESAALSLGTALQNLEAIIGYSGGDPTPLTEYVYALTQFIEVNDYVAVSDTVQGVSYYLNEGYVRMQYILPQITSSTVSYVVTDTGTAITTLNSFASTMVDGMIALNGTPQELADAQKTMVIKLWTLINGLEIPAEFL